MARHFQIDRAAEKGEMAELTGEGLGTEEHSRTENPGVLPNNLSKAGMRKEQQVEVNRTRSNGVNQMPCHTYSFELELSNQAPNNDELSDHNSNHPPNKFACDEICSWCPPAKC